MQNYGNIALILPMLKKVFIVICLSRSLHPIFLIAVLTALFGIPTQSNADEVILSANKDNTLFESAAGLFSNGAGSFIFAGKNGIQGGSQNRRGLIAFDVASFIPAGSIISSVQLDMNVSRSPFSASNVALHRVSQDWG